MQFSQPAFLWGLIAVLIPLAVHLFHLRRHRKVYFSNVDRLSALRTESRRHRNVRRWLVLAARMAAVALLVLAFARPVLPRGGHSALRPDGAVVSIYLDNSFSMEAASPTGTLLDAARQKAREVAAFYSLDTRFHLLTNRMEEAEMRWLSRDELLKALDAVEPVSASPTLSAVASRQLRFLRQGGSPLRHAYLISDFQLPVADLDALPTDSLTRFVLVPLAGVEADNLYIDTIRLDAPAYFAGNRASVEVTLRNGSPRAVEQLPVKLYLDGRERALATLDLPAGGQGTALLQFSLDRTGWIDGRVAIEDYPVSFDDNYYFTLQVGQPIGVLEVGGTGLHRLFASDSAISYRHEPHLPPSLDGLGLVVLNGLAALTSGEVRQLAEWATAGGSLLVVPPAGGAEGLNPLLSALGGPQLGQWARREVRATTIDYDSRLYSHVFAGRSDEMEMPTVQGHYLAGGGVAARQSVVGLADGSDLLSATDAGSGHLYLLSTPLDPEWTDLGQQALFVPTFFNMALYSRQQPAVCHTLGSSAPIPLQGSYPADRPLPELAGGAGLRLIPDLRRAGGRQLMVPHGELSDDGIYTLADEHLAFNHSRRESELRFMSAAEVARAAEGKPGYTTVAPTTRPLDDELRQRDGSRPLWPLCLGLALLALAAETLLLKLKP